MFETKTYKGYTIEIIQDVDFPINPREDMDCNIGIMACFHKRYTLGDKNHGIDSNQFSNWKEMEEYARKKLGAVVILPLYLYDHSGITISTGSFSHIDSMGWDWGRLGIIYTTKARLKEIGHDWKKITPKRKEQVKKWLLEEVKVYDQYLTGEVYGYKILDPDGEELDSCCGFFGYDHEASGLMDQARETIDGDTTRRLKEEGIQEEMELTEAV